MIRGVGSRSLRADMMHAYIHIYIYIYICIYTYILYICMRVCVFVCVYVCGREGHVLRSEAGGERVWF